MFQIYQFFLSETQTINTRFILHRCSCHLPESHSVDLIAINRYGSNALAMCIQFPVCILLNRTIEHKTPVHLTINCFINKFLCILQTMHIGAFNDLSSRHTQATELAMSRFAFQQRIDFFSSIHTWQWLIKNKNQPFSKWKMQTTETSPDPDNLIAAFLRSWITHRYLVFSVLIYLLNGILLVCIAVGSATYLFVYISCVSLCVCLFSCSRWSLAQFCRQSTESDWMNERTKKTTTTTSVCVFMHTPW